MKRILIFALILISLFLVFHISAETIPPGIDVVINQITASPFAENSKIKINFQLINTGSVTYNKPVTIEYHLVSVENPDIGLC